MKQQIKGGCIESHYKTMKSKKITKEKMKINWNEIEWDEVLMGTIAIGFAVFVLIGLAKAMFLF
jgi:hypothetical protein